MRGVPFFILSLALLPAAFGFTIEDRARLSLGANFEACSNLEAMLVEPGQVSMLALFENVSQFGSLTGFIDFSPTDSILRFLDEYVMAALPFNDLHSLLIGITGGEVVDLEYPAIVVRGEEAEEESL